jgi:hypothetical protein
VPYASPALFVAWRSPDSHRIFPVGRLLRIVGTLPGYEFAYIRGAQAAEAFGFRPFIAFPDMTQVYRSKELLPFFKNRVLSPSRPDYEQHVESLALEPDTAEPMTLLGLSGGKRATDLVEIFPDWIKDRHSASIKTRFLVRGVQYVEGAEERIQTLQGGDSLRCVADVQNAANPKALKLQTSDNRVIGFLPDYLASDISEIVRRGGAPQMQVLRVNPPPTPRHHRVLCSLVVPDPRALAGFRDETFRPISNEATSIDDIAPELSSPLLAAR